jgi:hypothetical protein
MGVSSLALVQPNNYGSKFKQILQSSEFRGTTLMFNGIETLY